MSIVVLKFVIPWHLYSNKKLEKLFMKLQTFNDPAEFPRELIEMIFEALSRTFIINNNSYVKAVNQSNVHRIG